MIKLLLARHGETDWNVARRFQGQTDVPLNANGVRQAAELGSFLSNYEIDAAYSSDLKRAYDTAQAVMTHHGGGIKTDVRLREVGFGLWEGLTWEQIREKDPDGIAAWMERAQPPQHAEPISQVAIRVTEVLDHIRAHHHDETVLIVAHGGTLHTLVSVAIGLDPSLRWRFQFANASLSEVLLHDDWASLSTLNQTHYLQPTAELTRAH